MLNFKPVTASHNPGVALIALLIFFIAIALLSVATAAYAQAATHETVAPTPLPKEELDKLPRTATNQLTTQSNNSTGGFASSGGSGGAPSGPVPRESLYQLPPQLNGSNASASASQGQGITGVAPVNAQISPGSSLGTGFGESGGSGASGQPALGSAAPASSPDAVPAELVEPQAAKTSIVASVIVFFKRLFGW